MPPQCACSCKWTKIAAAVEKGAAVEKAAAADKVVAADDPQARGILST